MKIIRLAISIATIFITVSGVLAASVEKAGMFNQHGLRQEAKSELINVIFSKSENSAKAKSYYLLGSIAFEENKISVALDSWRTLIKTYPGSDEAKLVTHRIDELAEIVGDSTKESVENAIALSYLRHGDFWSKGKSNIFTIDSSWIPNVETAIKWYDKVISEYPKTAASRVAYQDKLRTIFGWEGRGKYGSKYGLKESFWKYQPLLVETFASFEKDHPTASSLQGFRYQIAQAYWRQKDWEKTREWLNLIIEISGEGDSFYRDLSERRLQKVEH
ncbi:MAG: tetratricopeptide repeat protein [Pseudomonadales bacterium]|nr:tetratricopeptide repeat protein [Pseudomonadales bacterium]